MFDNEDKLLELEKKLSTLKKLTEQHDKANELKISLLNKSLTLRKKL